MPAESAQAGMPRGFTGVEARGEKASRQQLATGARKGKGQRRSTQPRPPAVDNARAKMPTDDDDDGDDDNDGASDDDNDGDSDGNGNDDGKDDANGPRGG